ncbi:ABC transporter ATP-binding protein [Microbacterium sp. No. 7]|uniref:ABC transporter ATP-binding protein n=1 Tax=Microbacterium sp. No. 7 TaxID=1714373 RepID=UPI0006D15100|nr:ABC transporter ATP-binding protein [Microbacterium sp. No. 7]ALJ20349.1 ABC transporter ATP-binding protein [Microbacterium sp. No. 7]
MTGDDRGDAAHIVSCRDVQLHFGAAHVLKDVTLGIPVGRTVGLVGESGSGKSTLAKAIVGMNRISSGSLVVAGHDISRLRGRERRRLFREVQYVPQDPYSSLNPRRRVGQTLAEAIDPSRADFRRHREEVERMLEAMWMTASDAGKYPHEFSGGQRQRIAIARALLVQPRLIVADEITSALDVSVQAEVVRLLQELRGRREHSMLFITHNLAVAQEVCDDVVVMLSGRVVETGPVESVFNDPRHEYTRRLLDSVPGAPGFSLA